MAEHIQGAGPSDLEDPSRVRIEAAPRERQLASAAQGLLVLLTLALVWAGARVVGLFWLERADPEVGLALWVFIGTLTLAASTLAWLIVLLQDLVKMTIELTPEGLAVGRWLAPFRARWDEVREIGLVAARGHVTVRSARGSVTATERLLGRAPFAALVAALRRHAPHAVQDWSAWAATRRQLVLFVGPALGLAFLLAVGQGLFRRRLPTLGRGDGGRR